MLGKVQIVISFGGSIGVGLADWLLSNRRSRGPVGPAPRHPASDAPLALHFRWHAHRGAFYPVDSHLRHGGSGLCRLHRRLARNPVGLVHISVFVPHETLVHAVFRELEALLQRQLALVSGQVVVRDAVILNWHSG